MLGTEFPEDSIIFESTFSDVLLNCSIVEHTSEEGSPMALGSTTCRQWHGVGEGGERGTERGGERTGGAGERGNGQGTQTGELGRGEEANGGRKGKVDRWWGAFKRTRGSTKEEVPSRFSTYNIRNGRNRGLESALRGMSQANMDLGIFQETKCTDGI